MYHWYTAGSNVPHSHEPCWENITALAVDRCVHLIDLPPSLTVTFAGSIGWIAGCGQAGSALLPFITGAVASKSGIEVLQPL